jgi:uncharacterized protein
MGPPVPASPISPGRLTDAIPNDWSVYFGVENTGAAVRLVEERGGMVITPPADSPQGRRATVADPMSAVFVIIGA